LKEENIKALTRNKDTFTAYVKKYYDRQKDFSNSSYYFHMRVIETIRTSRTYKELFKDRIFLELVYATLSTWGLDRMDGSARLVEFDIFQKSILDNLSLLEKLTCYKINNLSDTEEQQVKDKLSILFDNLKVMAKKAKLVGVSKALHHLLPDLVPPIDRKYTLDFFYGNANYGEKDQKEKFLAIFDKFRFISRELNLTEKDQSGQWDTSIPKLIDNAIIGFLSE